LNYIIAHHLLKCIKTTRLQATKCYNCPLETTPLHFLVTTPCFSHANTPTSTHLTLPCYCEQSSFSITFGSPQSITCPMCARQTLPGEYQWQHINWDHR